MCLDADNSKCRFSRKMSPMSPIFRQLSQNLAKYKKKIEILKEWKCVQSILKSF